MANKRSAASTFPIMTAATATTQKKRRLTPSQTTIPCDKLWLDMLPSDVCSRIASYACTGKQTPSALSLAKSSAAQRTHVVSALSGHLELCCDARYLNEDSEKRWAEIFSQDIKSLTLHRYFSLDIAVPDLPLALFNASTLLAAEIWNEPAFLRAVAKAPALRRLKVSFKHSSSTDVLFETLGELDLSELDLHCAGWGSVSCPFRELQGAGISGDQMSRSCSSLVTLRMHCDHGCHPWPFITALPTLRTVTLSSKDSLMVPETAREVFPLLRTMDSVEIRGGTTSFWLASELGSVVTCLVTTETLGALEVAQLVAFPRLEEVGIGLTENNEHLLIDSLHPSMGSLRSLRLVWAPPRIWSPRKYEWNVARFSSVASGVMLRMVQSCPLMAKLDLLYVRIGAAELRAILKHAGPRLEHLWMSIMNQDEPPFDRLEFVLQSLSLSNPGIRSLVLEKERIDTTALTTVLGVKAYKDSSTISQQGRRLYAALRLLQRSAPMFDAGVVEKWLTWYFWEQQGEIE